MFKELTDPIAYWNRYSGGTRYRVSTKDGSGCLGIGIHTELLFIDTTCSFYFETIAEAWSAACRYYNFHKMVYPYMFNSDGYCVNLDGSRIGAVPEPLEAVESKVMEFV